MRELEIEVSNISFWYRSPGEPALRDVSLSIDKGEFLGVIGPNGSGKTTFLRMLSGVLKPRRGRINICGRDTGSINRRELAKLLAMVPQETFITFPFTALEVVLMGRSPHLGRWAFESPEDLGIARECMKLTDTAKFENRLINELSGGEKQRVIIARALAQQPEILLLDEPTAFLDIGHQVEIYALLEKLNRERELTIVLVSQDLNLAAQHCRRLALFRDGEVMAVGKPEEVLTEETISEAYKTRVFVGQNELTGAPYVIPLGG